MPILRAKVHFMPERYLRPYVERNALHLHTFVRTGKRSDLRIPFDVVDSAVDTPFDVRYEWPDQPPLDAAAILGVDCYASETNQHGVLCQQRIGSATLPLRSVLDGSTFRLRVWHVSSRTTPGWLDVEAEISGTARFRPSVPHEWVPEHREATERLINTYVQAELEPFVTKAWAASHPFIERVHAPLHYSRCGALPGIAFWMRDGLRCDEDWCVHWLRLVCRRYDKTLEWLEQTIVAAFDTDGDHRDAVSLCSAIVLETACAPVNALEYIGDWVPGPDGERRRYCESFDELFVRGSGDCEDGSKAIIEVLRCFGGGGWRAPLMRAVARLCGLYKPVAVLGMVDAPTVRSGVAQDFQAHMFMNWVPLPRWHAWVSSPDSPETPLLPPNKPAFPSWVHSLPVLSGEGTGHVQPNAEPVPGTTIPPDGSRLEHHLQGVATPPFLDRMLRPAWITTGDRVGLRSFYKLHVHAFSDDGVWTFFDRRSGLYGVPSADVLRSDAHVVLKPHLPLPAALSAAIRSALALEHPMPTLSVAPRLRVPALRLPGWGTTTTFRSDVWTDVFVHPGRVSAAQLTEMQRWSAQLGVKGVSMYPEPDPSRDEGSTVRCRLYW